jgi:hypothetical protein
VADDWYYLLRVYDMRLVDAAAIDSATGCPGSPTSDTPR